MLSVVGESYLGGLQKLFNSNSKLDVQSLTILAGNTVWTSKCRYFRILIFKVLLLIDVYKSDLMHRVTLGYRHYTNDCLQNTRVLENWEYPGAAWDTPPELAHSWSCRGAERGWPRTESGHPGSGMVTEYNGWDGGGGGGGGGHFIDIVK